MKRFLVIGYLLVEFFIANATTYYSQGSLDPGSLSSWGTLVSGGTAPLSFTVPGDVFVIQNGHSMTTITTWTVGATGSKLQIQNGGVLGADHPIIIAGTFQIDNGGTYIHNNTGSVAQSAGLSIFSGTELFEPNSNFEIRNWSNYLAGLPNTSPGITWGNLIINLQVNLGGIWAWGLDNNRAINIAGNLDIRSTFLGGPLRELRIAGNGLNTSVNIGGNLLVSGTSYLAIKKNGSPPLNGVTSVQINGNIHVGVGSVLEITGNTAGDGAGCILSFKGDLINEGTITTSGNTNTINDLELNGTSNQNISNTGTLSGSRLVFIMNNSAGATLNSKLTLPGNLSLLNGKIRTTATNILEMLPNTVATPDLVNPEISFVEGPMRKIGDDPDFTFPVGKGGVYAPITMNTVSGAGTDDVFTAEYIRGNPQSAIGSAYDALSNFDHISYVEYWRLTQDNGNAIKSIAVAVSAASFCKDLDNTFVSRYQPGTGWVNEGRQVMGMPSSSGPFVVATLRIGPANTISQFGYFTLATNQPFAINPLPVKLMFFNSTKLSDKKALLEWELAECCVNAVKFQVEKAGADQRFFSIATTGGNEASRFYSVYDHDLKAGLNYYRLKITDVDGTTFYSRIVVVMNGVSGVLLTLSPAVTNGEVRLTITSATALPVDLLVADMTGRIVQKNQYKIQPGNNTIPLSLAHLHNGAYLIYGLTANGRTNPIRFIKQ